MSQTNLPDYLKQYVTDNPTTANDVDALTSVKTSVPRISMKGKRFKFINGEEESKSMNTIDVAILAVEPQGALLSKTFYRSGYNPNEVTLPDCSSADGIYPDAWVENPVNDKCSNCTNNMFGSATSMAGKKSKACRDSKILWVAKPDDIQGAVYGLRVPVTSLKPLAEFGRNISSMRVPLAVVITELGLDDDSEYPKLTFTHKGFLNADVGPKAIERSESREWIQKREARTAVEYKPQTETFIDVKPVTVSGDSNSPKAADLEKLSEGW